MTDQQLTLLLAALATVGGVIGTAIRWAVGRIVKALDANSASNDRTTAAMTAQAETNRVLVAEIRDGNREVAENIRHVADWCDAHTGVTSVPEGIRAKPPGRRPSPVAGTPTAYSLRPKTQGDR